MEHFRAGDRGEAKAGEGGVLEMGAHMGEVDERHDGVVRSLAKYMSDPGGRRPGLQKLWSAAEGGGS